MSNCSHNWMTTSWCPFCQKEEIDALKSKLEETQKELAKAKKDSARYRLVNDPNGVSSDWPGAVHDVTGVYPNSAEEADRALDEEIARKALKSYR